MTDQRIRAISYGGGVQSTALIVLATQGIIEYDFALFSNVGEKAEHPDTLTYVRNVMTPWINERNQPQLVELSKCWQRGDKKGQSVDLWDEIVRRDKRSIPIPIRMQDTGAPGNRLCTIDYKIRVVSRWLKGQGATANNPATVAIGISTDEFQRANRRTINPAEQVTYPLLDLGLSRQDCMKIIADIGLPVPPKSSCFFCPFHKPQYFSELRRDRPDLFEKAAQLEAAINQKRADMGKDDVYLTRFGTPLHSAVPEAQETLFENEAWSSMDGDGTCDDGYCFT